MADISFPEGDTLDVKGNLRLRGSFLPGLNRTDLVQDTLLEIVQGMEKWRIWDAFASVLTGTPGTDDLGLVSDGTTAPYLSAGDLKAAGPTTRYAACTMEIPPEYQAGQTVTIMVSGGMLTTVSDTTATVDLEVKLYQDDTTLGSDICATAAQTINSTSFSDISFTVTPASLNPGDQLHVRLAVACNDAATGTAVTPAIAKVSLKCDMKG